MDFVHVMKDWRRMCKAYTTDDKSCCDGCPVADFREHGCGAIFEMEDSTDWERYADAIRAWAVEHPEPVYPTWEEWLQSVGVMESSEGLLRRIKGQLYIDGIPAHAVPTAKVLQPMDADIAQKLGIEPKEG